MELHGGGIKKPFQKDLNFWLDLPDEWAYNRWIETHIWCEKCGHSPFEHRNLGSTSLPGLCLECDCRLFMTEPTCWFSSEPRYHQSSFHGVA